MDNLHFFVPMSWLVNSSLFNVNGESKICYKYSYC
jgi:hypothetical protein